MWVTEYTPEAIRANTVKAEGIYQLKVMNVKTGSMKPKNGEQYGKKYFQVECIINAEGYPKVSVFLTEGPGFNGEATAFFDTFGIRRGNFNAEEWRDHIGLMFIKLETKDGYTNMRPRYNLDANGNYINPNTQQQSPAPQYQPQNTSQPQYQQQEDSFGDIPF